MNKIKEKLENYNVYKNLYKICVTVVGIVILVGIYIYNQNKEYKQVVKNQYDMAFYELVGYAENVEVLLAKSLLSKSPEYTTQTLTEVWRDANLAQSYISQLPMNGDNISYTSKYLNQVSDFSYSLARKSMKNIELTEEDLKNLEMLHDYSYEMLEVLNQLETELQNGEVSWKDLNSNSSFKFAQQVSNISKDTFGNINKNLDEYEGLIYDGAFSEHMTSLEKKGLTGDDISQEDAIIKVQEFFGKENIDNVNYIGYSEGDIPCYSFEIEQKNSDTKAYIDITKKGGHIIFMTIAREVEKQNIKEDEAAKIAIDYLKEKGYDTVIKTYYLKENNALTINFAYIQNDIIVYSDLLKVKVALDNGEILGLESRGYLNCHYVREFDTPKITMEEAESKLNNNLEIKSKGLALIPTEWNSEVLCYEFKGILKEREFLIYINAITGEEQDIKMIINTPNGKLAM